MTLLQTATSSFVTVRRVGSATWILRLTSGSGAHVADELTAAFERALACDARDVVVELRDVPCVDPAVVLLLETMAAELLARDASLWVAARWPDGRGHTLRPVRTLGLHDLEGIDDALDRAVASCRNVLSARDS